MNQIHQLINEPEKEFLLIHETKGSKSFYLILLIKINFRRKTKQHTMIHFQKSF
jgi:hypothetical protein